MGGGEMLIEVEMMPSGNDAQRPLREIKERLEN